MGRGRKRLVDEKAAEFIRSNATLFTPLEMAAELNISERVISNYIRANGIKYTLRKPMGKRKIPQVPEDCFNVHERENWIA